MREITVSHRLAADGDIGTLRAEMQDGLALNRSRTQLLIEDVRGDIRLLAEAVANPSKKKKRS